ncbi:MAG: FKBP-type peptidyl-prolyl cis-trans isomerase [Bacteroidales bacterium]|nr:FKBP-type peptidyl-prolyl cis-trans isomerase [Bacteroidales bacterium]
MKAIIFVYGCLICTIFLSCSNRDFITDDSGLMYKFVVENKNERQPQPGEIMEVAMYYTNEKDSILYDTREFGKTFRMKVKNPTLNGGTIDDGILLMHKGDSAIFKVDAIRFFTETKQEEVPSFIKPGEKLTFYIKIYNIYTVQEYMEMKRKQSFQNEEEEMQALQSYLKLANITIKPLPSGLYYIEKVKGKGKAPSENSWVSIHYLGTFINGEPFDNTYERNQPFEFQIGQNQVIPGLEEGIKLMKEGGEAILIIPSKLAYGDQQYKMIPPFSTLIFEVQLIKVK